LEPWITTISRNRARESPWIDGASNPREVCYYCCLSDPEVVKSILLKAAKDHPCVLTRPAPFYDFEDFDVDGLKFKLYAFVDRCAGGIVTADLQIAILRAFQQTGIAISSRQPEVWQTVDLLRETAEYLSMNSQKNAVEAGTITSRESAKRPANLVSS
jgi:potassium-dependent mechanosensitive channel